MNKPFLVLLTGIIFLIFGIYSLLKPKNIQKHYVNEHTKYKSNKEFLKLIKSPEYIFWLRFGGILALIGAAFCFYVYIKTHLG